MRKALIIIGIIFALGSVLRGCAWGNYPPTILPSTQSILPATIKDPFNVVVWVDQETLLLTVENSISTYNIHTEKLSSIFRYGMPIGNLSSSCQEGDLWWFNVSFYRNTIVIDFSGNDVKIEEVERFDERFPSGKHSNSYCLRRSQGISREGLHITKNLVPDSKHRSMTDLVFSYDLSRNVFLWLHEARSLVRQDDHVWPLAGWLIDPTTKEVQEVKLPEGPWVFNYYLWDEASFSSCGASCHMGIDMYIAAGEIYAHVHGKVKNGAAGVYRFHRNMMPGSSSWERLIVGKVEPNSLAFHPNGCVVAYKQQGHLYLENVCITMGL